MSAATLARLLDIQRQTLALLALTAAALERQRALEAQAREVVTRR